MINSPALDYCLTPGVLVILAGCVLTCARGWGQRLLVLAMPIVALLKLWNYSADAQWSCAAAGFNLQLLHVTSAGRLFATAFIIALWLGGMFALQSASRAELASAFVYAGSAISVTLCGDLVTLFLFWELMALASTMVIWSYVAGGEATRRAGLRYLLVHLFGGVVLLAGIAGMAASGADLTLGIIHGDSLARWLILVGFLVNAGAPPLSFWIADAYPASSPSGMVFLAAFTTKTAVYVLLSYFVGTALLISVGLYMAVYGAVYAVRETNVRRILAYSVVNQVGFMVAAVGIGTPTALNGATAHAFAHIMYKTVLLLGAGSVLLSVGKDQAADLGNLARRMPWTTTCVIVGALASMGVPLTSSFVTKSLIIQAASEQQLLWSWIILTVCSAAVVFNAGVRFPWLTFLQPQQSAAVEQGRDPALLSRVALGGGAGVCVLVGVFPQQLYALLPFAGSYHPYSLSHVVEQLQLLVPAALLFFATLPLFSVVPQRQLDTDWLLRKPLLIVWQDFVLQLFALGLRGRSMAVSSLIRGFKIVFRHHGPRGVLSRSWPTGSIALWVAILLASYVLLFNL
jgi:multicomponent Na+:H+ antiporter subunit D